MLFRSLVGSSALLRAATAGKYGSVKALLAAGAVINHANKKGLTPFIAAAFNGDERMLDFLFDNGAEADAIDVTGKSAIIYASARGFTVIVGKLLDRGIDVNRQYGNNLTALMWAAGYSNDVPPQDGLATVHLLMERGADVTPRDNRGWTALTTAAYRNHPAVIEQLLAAGADPAPTDKEGRTPLAIAKAKGSMDAAALLISRGG
mgnify:FL=1